MANNLLIRLRQFICEINLFAHATSTAETVHQERLSTRIYLLSLIILVCTVCIVAGLTFRTVNRIEYSPTVSQFERLLEAYPDTLTCPCTHIKIPYGSFVTVHAEFHQVCSSEFITQTWIDSIYVQNNSLSLSATVDDIRSSLSTFWQVIIGFCYLSKDAWSAAMTTFNVSTLLTRTAISKDLVQIKAQTDLDFSVATVQAILSRSLLAIQRTTTINELVSGLSTNFYTYFTTVSSYYLTNITTSPKRFHDCLCSNMNGCPHPATVHNSEGQLITLPGVVSDCLIVDAVLASTLECYYDHTCFSNLYQQTSINISLLSANLNKHFSQNSTVQELLNELMTDELSLDIIFESFYNQCNPNYCSYIYLHRFDVFYVITTIIGIIGGLSFILRLIAPFITNIILYCKSKSTSNNIDDVPLQPKQTANICQRLRLLPSIIQQRLVSLNLFEGQGPHTAESQHQERTTTRLFIVLLVVSTVGFGFYAFISIHNQLVIVAHPSLATYLNLYSNPKYSTTLQCPCSQISVPYVEFLNVTFILHQVCSSDVVTPAWINYLSLYEPTMSEDFFSVIDFRRVAPTYFQFLAFFCNLTRTTIDNALRTFIATTFVNDRLLYPSRFAEETQSLISSFIKSTSNDFKRTLSWIIIAARVNQLVTGTNVNSYVTIDTNDNIKIVDPTLYYIDELTESSIFIKDVCSCSRDAQACSMPLTIYFNISNGSLADQYFVGMLVGCIPLFGFLQSTIEWLYNSTYLELILSTYALNVPLNYSPPFVKSLNASIETRFENGDLNELINEMLIETWINNSYFDRFYNACAPASCSYTIDKRRSIITALLLLIAICGGLNKALKIFVPIGVHLIFLIIRKRKNLIESLEQFSIFACIRNLPNTGIQWILTLNVFQSNSTDATIQRNGRIFTRVYLVLFTSIMITIILYNSFVERTRNDIQTISSYIDYEQLLARYPDSLQCSCTQISIPYSSVITELGVESYHPICTSDLLSSKWLNYLRTYYGEPSWLSQNDFRYWSPAFFQSIQLFCSLAQDNVANSLLIFNSTSLITDEVISRVQFNTQMKTFFNYIQTSIAVDFSRTLDILRITAQGNALITIFSSNWKLTVNENKKSTNATLLNIPVSYYNNDENTTCSCATSRLCSTVASMFYPNLTFYYLVEGIRFGCFPMESLLSSSLSCFYSSSCLNAFLYALPPTEKK